MSSSDSYAPSEGADEVQPEERPQRPDAQDPDETPGETHQPDPRDTPAVPDEVEDPEAD
jgi:hypothetical protein